MTLSSEVCAIVFGSSFWTHPVRRVLCNQLCLSVLSALSATQDLMFPYNIALVLYLFVYLWQSRIIQNGSNDFDQTCSECRTNQFWGARETACPRNFCSRDIHPQSSNFGHKWPKWCPKILLSRTENATENLWYLESMINFLSCTSHQIFTYL